MNNLSDFNQVVSSLEEHSGVFNALMGSSNIQTNPNLPFIAAVGFNKNWKQFTLMINPVLWNRLSFVNKKFVLMHEMVHILFSHLKYFQKRYGYDRQKLNLATDICVNHAIVRGLGLPRPSIDDWQKFCWVDTVPMKGGVIPSPDETFQYYYDLIDDSNGQNQSTVDDHEGFDQIDEATAKEIKNVVEKALEKCSEQELKQLDQMAKKASPEGGFNQVIENRKAEAHDACWNKVTQRMDFAVAKERETWRLLNPRIGSNVTGFDLPGIEEPEKRIKKNAFLFLDVSGSCIHLVDDFVRISKTFPRKKFRITKHVFSTTVEKVVDDKYRVGGGTSFKIIEDYLSKLRVYPDAVFVITDGEGDSVNPKFPERWQFFLDGSKCTSLIPPKSQIWDLRTLEKIKRDR